MPELWKVRFRMSEGRHGTEAGKTESGRRLSQSWSGQGCFFQLPDGLHRMRQMHAGM